MYLFFDILLFKLQHVIYDQNALHNKANYGRKSIDLIPAQFATIDYRLQEKLNCTNVQKYRCRIVPFSFLCGTAVCIHDILHPTGTAANKSLNAALLAAYQ